MTPKRLGPYAIEKLLGQGGMGSVYLATHIETELPAAVKTLSSVLSRDEDFRERFAAEIESLKKLQHPNIVRLFGWGEQDGTLFYSMEFVEGQSLQERMAGGDRVEWREAIQIGIDVCKALKHAHDNGIIHRDLKPANLLVDGDGTVKLTDFGIAKLFGHTQLTVEGGVVGTADYMAPEQALGKPVNHRCDLYSLGTVLFTLLAGHPPFVAKSMPEVVHKVCYQAPQPIRRFNASVPRQFEELISELLEKEADRRPPTARALTTRLEAMQHGLTESGLQHMTDPDEDADFDYTEPGATVVPGEPYIHSATTRFAPSGDVSEPASDAEAAGHDSSATGAPAKDVTTPGDSSTPQSEKGKFSKRKADQASTARFTTIEEDSLAASYDLQHNQPSSRWVIVALAGVLLAIAGFVAWQIRALPSADELYSSITAAAEGDDAALAAVSPQIDRFLRNYPDDARAEEVQALQEEVELNRLQNSFERRARRLGGTSTLSSVEREYLEAVDLGRTHPEAAIARLTAIINVYDSDGNASKETKQVITLAQRQLHQLEGSLQAQQQQALAELRERMETAAALESEEPAKALAIYEGIALLYQDRGWAKEIVDQSHAAAERLTDDQ